MDRTINLHAFVSAKGGVGKSTLAITRAALLAANRNRSVVLLDADLTGTSIADGLRLLAPEIPLGEDGAPDFFNPPSPPTYLSRDKTVELRRKRKFSRWLMNSPPLPPPPPFMNDVLVRGDRTRECQIAALCWKHEHDDHVNYLPSSPFKEDIDIALGWLYVEEPYRWLQRLAWLLDDMRKQMPSLTDIVIDLPPGLFGFAHEILALFANLEKEEPPEPERLLPAGFPGWRRKDWKTYPVLVTTPDRNDLAIAMEYWLANKAVLPELKVLLNRYNQRVPLDKWFSEWFPEVQGLYDMVNLRVDYHSALSELFIQGRLVLDPEVSALLRKSMELEALP